MDPFRDDLTAAHAKIAQLEAHVARLKDELRARDFPTSGARRSTTAATIAIVTVASLCALGAAVATVLARREPASATASSRSPAIVVDTVTATRPCVPAGSDSSLPRSQPNRESSADQSGF
jgi:hypothetical protein